MIDAKSAQAQLQALVVPSWTKALSRRIDRLGLKPATRALLAPVLRVGPRAGDADDSLGGWSRSRSRWIEVHPEEQLRVLTSVFPRLEPQIRRAWTAFEHAPYTHGYVRKAFRAPGHNAIHSVRTAWFQSVIEELGGLDQDVEWLAAWAPHLMHLPDRPYDAGQSVPPLLAAAMDEGGPRGEAVFEILKDSASGRHDIGMMGPHVVRTMLACGRPDAWEFIETMLLAAQREEGLRQSILEAVDESHPEAFRRMLKLILEENLARFSSVVRAVDVWFGLFYDAASTKHAEGLVQTALTALEGSESRERLIEGKDAEKAYVALWSIAYENAPAAVERATKLLGQDSNEDRRFVAVQLLQQVGLPECVEVLGDAMRDKDLRVAAHAFYAWAELRNEYGPVRGERDASDPRRVEALELLLARVEGRKRELKGKVFPWIGGSISASDVLAHLIRLMPAKDVGRLRPHIDQMDPDTRAALALAMADLPDVEVRPGRISLKGTVKLKPGARDLMLELMGDGSKSVREVACRLMSGQALADDEVARWEDLLQRSASDIRATALKRLLQLPDQKAMACARRLIEGTDQQRLAGLELLREMSTAKRAPAQVGAMVRAWRESHAKRSASEEKITAFVIQGPDAVPRLLDGLGLVERPGELVGGVAGPKPQGLLARGRKLLKGMTGIGQGADGLGLQGTGTLWSLHAFVLANKDVEIEPAPTRSPHADAGEPLLLGGRHYWRVESPKERDTIEANRAAAPKKVVELIAQWLASRAGKPSGDLKHDVLTAWLQLTVAIMAYGDNTPMWPRPTGKPKEPEVQEGVGYLLEWALCLHGDGGMAHWMLDRADEACHRGHVNRGVAINSGFQRPTEGRKFKPEFASDWVMLANQLPFQCDDRAIARIFEFVRQSEDAAGPWRERVKGRLTIVSEEEAERKHGNRWDTAVAAYLRPAPEEFVRAWRVGAANEQDLYRWALLPQQMVASTYGEVRAVPGFEFLPALLRTRDRDRRNSVLWPESLNSAIERLTGRVLEIEFSRGDAPTEVSGLAHDLAPCGGAEVLLRALRTLGRARLQRGYNRSDGSLTSVCSAIISHTRVGPEDTPERFAALAREFEVDPDRLVEVALFVPHWARHIERAIGMEGLEDGVWWIRAHTKDTAWHHDGDVLEAWDAQIAERTPVAAEDLSDGAVDAAWFSRVHDRLGSKNWEKLYDAAKFACGNAGHKRAQLFADAMLGEATESQVVERINAKRHQDSVRALGLVPLRKGATGRKQILERYRLMQEFRRTSRKHGGSMLQASEKRAVEIGMENLARLAGYPDPLRLQWAMETREVEDLAKGPVSVKVGEVVVSLSVDEDGVPGMHAVKGGKNLASVPAAARKHARVKDLSERLSVLRRQGARMRQSLEQAMCRGDEFEASELATLFGHPILRPMICRLVFVGPHGVLGYPDEGGRVLRDQTGRLEPLAGDDRMRIAHPLDLLANGRWDEWQRECFAAERVQPFKQVFREVYVPTAGERDAKESVRYQNQQVQPRQAMALLGSRGWIARPEEGVARTFHAERVTAMVTFEEYFHTPGEIEGLTLQGVVFYHSSRDEFVPLSKVPGRVFTEVMRDLDLVVSVAHRGGVDPEASQSSMEMRAALLRELCTLLGLTNVRVEDRFAKIAGTLGQYAVHLGSATVQKLPGESIIISPVLSQHRGRIFLPFADDDPKSAEVVTKVITLARDREIKDPTILEQLAK